MAVLSLYIYRTPPARTQVVAGRLVNNPKRVSFARKSGRLPRLSPRRPSDADPGKGRPGDRTWALGRLLIFPVPRRPTTPILFDGPETSATFPGPPASLLLLLLCFPELPLYLAFLIAPPRSQIRCLPPTSSIYMLHRPLTHYGVLQAAPEPGFAFCAPSGSREVEDSVGPHG